MTRTLPFALLLSLSWLAACGGSGSDDAPARPVASETRSPVIDESSPPVPSDGLSRRVLEGRVVEAIDTVPLVGVTVALRESRGGDVIALSATDENGRYAFGDATTDAAELSFSLDGYRAERLGIAPDAPFGDAALETVRLVSDDNSGIGSASGRILDAGGEPVTGLTVAFVRGAGRVNEDAAVITTTSEDGSWTIAELGYGNWICIVYGPGFTTSYTTLTVLGGVDLTDLESTALPELADDEIAIVTTRDPGAPRPTIGMSAIASFSDPEPEFTIYPSVPGSSRVSLDAPHVIVLRLPAEGTLTYTISKHLLASYAPMNETGTRVRVVDVRGVRAEFTASSPSRGDRWSVFEMTLADGTLRTIDTVR